MKTYYDLSTCYSITVDDGEIIKVSNKRLFKYDVALTYTEEEKVKYGSFGTAMYSGRQGKQYVEYINTFLVDSSGGSQKVDILSGSAICSITQPDISVLKELGVPAFWTNLTDFMPIFGYVCFHEKLAPMHSYFESKAQPLEESEYKKVAEVLDFLPGDDIGQLAQYLLHGGIAYNGIMESVLPNPFYGKTLSLLPLSKPTGKQTVLITRDMFQNKVTKDHFVNELATYCPVSVTLDEEQKKIFGDFENLSFYCGTYPQYLSSFWGLITKLSDSKVGYVFSYDMPYAVVAGTNMIGQKQI